MCPHSIRPFRAFVGAPAAAVEAVTNRHVRLLAHVLSTSVMARADDEALRQLQGSVLFSKTFPKRTLTPHAEWARLSEEERLQRLQARVDAIQQLKNTRELADVVRRLGHAKYEAAVPALAQLWKECAVEPVRVAAGHALRDIGTFAARAALKELVWDADRFSVFMAVRALFDEDPASAFDRLSGHFEEKALLTPAGSAVAEQILATFCPSYFKGANEPCWTEPRAPQWLRDDSRWVQLCIRHRKHPALGQTARDVLRYADKDQVTAELDAARTQEPPKEVRWTTQARGDLLSRYRQGEHVAVWEALRRFEAISGSLREEAFEVARETMRRVLHNSGLLIARLKDEGWMPLSGVFHTPPSNEDVPVMAEIEARTGALLPVSIKAFWEVVGGIDLIWDYNRQEDPPGLGLDFGLTECDPVSVEPARVVRYLFEEWDDSHDGIDPEVADPYRLDLAPDYLHKAAISGGAPYGVELPSGSAAFLAWTGARTSPTYMHSSAG
jgi:hypothetical protein